MRSTNLRVHRVRYNHRYTCDPSSIPYILSKISALAFLRSVGIPFKLYGLAIIPSIKHFLA